MEYGDFIRSRVMQMEATGFSVDKEDLNQNLFPFQKPIVQWAIRKGRACLFEDCGLGKTIQSLEWAHQVILKTGGNVLIVAPLAVATQTVGEGKRFGYHVTKCRTQDDARAGINITNYEMLAHFDQTKFEGVVLDESSILKSYSGKIRNQIIDMFSDTDYRLACTATPAPNDYEELGNHVEFLGIMTRVEMLGMFFIAKNGLEHGKRLKKHAEVEFWRWVSSWAVFIRKPSDIGFDNNGFDLPELKIHHHILAMDKPLDGKLFVEPARTLSERRQARRESISERTQKTVEILSGADGQCLVWCNLNDESAALSKAISGAVEIKGSDTAEHKESALIGFVGGEIETLVTKPRIAGFGMNFQNAHTMVFAGLSDSYEQFYQAIRRSWRFGQKNKVDVHIVISEAEVAVMDNIDRKHKQVEKMATSIARNISEYTIKEIGEMKREAKDHKTDIATGTDWKLHLGDCVDVYREIESDSVGFTIFSPPFVSLYVYSDLERDMGNCKNDEEFFKHFAYLIPEIYRTTMPGRCVSIHCMNLSSTKTTHGHIGIRDFRGEIIQAFEKEGFYYHSEHVIWKDPLVQAMRSKVIGLLHKQICKDSALCRAGLPDYLVTLRKPGENPKPIDHPNGLTRFVGLEPPTVEGRKFSHFVWQKYASPVWMDIDIQNTLNHRAAKAQNDERHVCPLQLDVIERALTLWSKEGDLVASPFAGIGSEGYVAVKMNRRFIGAELKESYFDIAKKNLASALEDREQLELFG